MVLKLLFGVLLLTISGTAFAGEGNEQPDPELLEFLGRIAGLESLGVDIDTLLVESLEDSLQREEDNDEQS